jgi:hypothetical protein
MKFKKEMYAYNGLHCGGVAIVMPKVKEAGE